MGLEGSKKFLPEAVVLVTASSLVVYLLTLSSHGSWLDSGEFVASAASLGITHPPGHPLQSIWSSFFTFLPLGTLAFRVSLASATAAALGSGALCLLIFRLLRVTPLERNERLGFAVVGALSVSVSPAIWEQATRPEVYALQFLLSMVVCERLVAALEPRTGTGDPERARRAIYLAAFVWGLSLCNHHFLALLLLPAAAIALHRFPFGVGLRCAVLALVGLLPYLYLPLRATQAPTPNFGEPTTLARWFWVVSAKTFQKNTGGAVIEPLSKRALDVLAFFDEHLTLVGLLLAVAGMGAALRVAPWRRVVLALASVVGLAVLARSWLGHNFANPDARGYLAAGLALSTAFVTVFFAFAVTAVRSAGFRRVAAVSVLSALSALAVVRTSQIWDLQDRSLFTSPDGFDDVAFRRAPAKAIVILHDPETIFRALQYLVEFDVPPSELLVVPTPFLAYPGMIESLVEEEPLLRQALTHYALDGHWDASQLQSLASSRTLLMEMNPFLEPEVVNTLIPSVYFMEVLSSEAYPEDRNAALGNHAEGHEHLQRLVGELPSDRKTRDRLLLHHYQDSLYFALVGQADAAKEAVARGLSLNPHAKELIALDRALETSEGPLDISPFVPPDVR